MRFSVYTLGLGFGTLVTRLLKQIARCADSKGFTGDQGAGIGYVQRGWCLQCVGNKIVHYAVHHLLRGEANSV